MKKFKVVFYDEALIDVKDGIDYYKKISLVLAKKFHSAIGATERDLIKNPFYQIRYDNFRLKQVKKFPYLFHYILDESIQTVFVYGVRNSNKDPESSYFFDK